MKPEAVPEDRHGNHAKDREALREVRRRLVSAEKTPLPASHRAVSEQSKPFNRRLKSRRPVVEERNQIPGGGWKCEEKRRGQQCPAGGDEQREPGKANGLTDAL